MTPRRAIQATSEQLRKWFEDDGIGARIAEGTLREEIKADRAAPGHIGPVGTRSQLVRYFDGENLVTEVHRYLLPDGSIGASGMPDPKGVLHDGQWYFTPG